MTAALFLALLASCGCKAPPYHYCKDSCLRPRWECALPAYGKSEAEAKAIVEKCIGKGKGK